MLIYDGLGKWPRGTPLVRRRSRRTAVFGSPSVSRSPPADFRLCRPLRRRVVAPQLCSMTLLVYSSWYLLSSCPSRALWVLLSNMQQGWFIFTFLLILCTLKSTFVFCGIFVAVDIAFLLLGIGYIHRNGSAEPNKPVIKAGGFFALLAAFQSWYVCLAGLANSSNSFFTVPVFHMPWARGKRG